MDNRKIIQESIDYIEENLKAEMIAQELAESAGFSLFHFYRLFQMATGMPVMQYILKRKLLHALYEISEGAGMTETALAYGFETFAGFYKACKREIGYTPSELLKRYRAHKPYKINLFKEEHIMLTRKKISEVLGNWGLQQEEIKDIFYEETGNYSENAFYVGENHIIKFSANLGNVLKHLELTKALEEAGFLTAGIVKTVDKRAYVESDGLYYYVTTGLKGVRLKASDMLLCDGEFKAQCLGEMIGQLHLVLKNLDMVTGEVNAFEDVKNWALARTKEVMSVPEKLCSEYMEVFETLQDKLPRQIIHRDPNPSNVIRNRSKEEVGSEEVRLKSSGNADQRNGKAGKEIWGFVDFELSERNMRIYDPCYAATAILSEWFMADQDKEVEKWPEVYKNIMMGYDRVVGLTEEEKVAIPYVILTNQFICVAWFADQGKYEEMFSANIKMTEWIFEHFEELRL